MKRGFIAAITVAIMSFILALTMGVYMLVTSLNKQEKYVLYVGVPSITNDIKSDVKNICKKHVEGYTFVEGAGGYTDEDGTFVSEKTIILTFCNTNEETVKAIAKEILKDINNSTVLMETSSVTAVHSSTGFFGEITPNED